MIQNLFTGKKFAPAPLDDAESLLVKKLEGHTMEHPDMPDTVRGECPDWAAERLKKRFGKNFGNEMAALLEPAPLDLRVNPLKTTREEALAVLKKNGFAAEACKLSPLGIRLHERPALNTLSLLKDGSVEIQDEGSQLVALLVDARPGQRVVDFCAGAGGKTLAMAAEMQNKGRIVACDVLANRLERSAERFRRAGVHNIDIKPLTSERDPWVKRHKATFDRVLVDAPCSGTGTWRRNPDQRWRSLGPGLETLVPLQASILASAARLVKPGGHLIYATCSLLPDENEQQIEAFLSAHPDFKVVPVETLIENIIMHKGRRHPGESRDPSPSLTASAYSPITSGRSGREMDPDFRRDDALSEGLSKEPTKKVYAALTTLKNSLKFPTSYLAITPAGHNTDGFFAAVLERSR